MNFELVPFFCVFGNYNVAMTFSLTISITWASCHEPLENSPRFLYIITLNLFAEIKLLLSIPFHHHKAVHDLPVSAFLDMFFCPQL